MLLWSLALWGLYLIVDVEDRYVFAALTALLLLTASAVRLPSPGTWRPIVSACVLVLVCGVALRSLETASDKVYRAVKEKTFGPYSDPYWQVAQTLKSRLNLQSGDSLACLEHACESPYWARLAGLRIVADIPREAEYWGADNDSRNKALGVLAATGVKALIGTDPRDGAEAEGWIPLGRIPPDRDLYAKRIAGTE